MCVTREALLSAVVLAVSRDGHRVRDDEIEPLRALGVARDVIRRAFEALPPGEARTHALARIDALWVTGG